MNRIGQGVGISTWNVLAWRPRGATTPDAKSVRYKRNTFLSPNKRCFAKQKIGSVREAHIINLYILYKLFRSDPVFNIHVYNYTHELLGNS